MRVHEVQDKTIVVDFNHRWLNFDMKVTDIKAAEERSTPALCIASNKKPGLGHPQPGHNMLRIDGFQLSPLFFPISARFS